MKQEETILFSGLVLMSCRAGRTVFCVSMDSNKTDNYSIGLNIEGDTLYLDIKDSEFEVFNGEATEFNVDYVTDNLISVDVPENIDSNEMIGNSIWADNCNTSKIFRIIQR